MRNAHPFRKLAHASVLLLATWLTLRIYNDVDGTEFMGGTVTGPIFHMSGIAIIAFLIGGLLAYPFPRIASTISLLASLMSFPILAYFIAPGPFRAVFRGNYSVPLRSNFEWNRWLVETAITVLIIIVISAWNLLSPTPRKLQRAAAL